MMMLVKFVGRGYQSTDQKSPTSPLPPPLQEDEKSKQEEEWRRELVQVISSQINDLVLIIWTKKFLGIGGIM